MKAVTSLTTGPAPRREALDLVVDVWARQRTGEFLGAGGKISVILGEPVDDEGLAWLASGMCRAELRFRDGEVDGAGGVGRVPLGPTLLEAGRRLGSTAAVRAGLDDPLVAGPYAEVLGRLPLRPATRRLVRDALSGNRPLRAALASLSLGIEAVEQDIASLVALGVLRSRGIAPPRLRSSGGVEPAASSDLRQRQLLSQRRLTTRLEREWETLSRSDDWAVLGTAPGSDSTVLQRGAARMRARYAALAADVDDPATRQLLRSLRERVEVAIDRLRVPETVSSTGDEVVPGPEQAMRLGQEAAVRGDLALARRWFGLAQRQDPDDPITRAWYGWSMVVDPRTSTGGAVDRGRRMVRQALSLAPRDPSVLERAVEVAIHLGEAAEARQHLQALVEVDPQHPSLRSLMHRVGRL